MGTSLLAGDGDIASDWIVHVQRRYSAPISTLFSHLSLALRRMTLVLKEGIFFPVAYRISTSHPATKEVCCAFQQSLLESIARNKQAVRSG